MYIDAHFHLADYLDCCASNEISAQFAYPTAFCCSAHERVEYTRHRAFANAADTHEANKHHAGNDDFQLLKDDEIESFQQHGIAKPALTPGEQNTLLSFGIHPQNPVMDEAEFLYGLLENKQIHAIGECGFDLFDASFKELLPQQLKVWQMQVQWAAQFQLPLVIHCRKALPLLFAEIPRLKKVPAVIFHGWGGSPQEATSFLKKGVNAYFSIGKAVLRGQKSVCTMAATFDIRRLLTETDAPYMRLKAESFSHPRDIIAVTTACAALRSAPAITVTQYESSAAAQANIIPADETIQQFSAIIEHNFYCAFGISGKIGTSI